jgi:hypothetical protein
MLQFMLIRFSLSLYGKMALTRGRRTVKNINLKVTGYEIEISHCISKLESKTFQMIKTMYTS